MSEYLFLFTIGPVKDFIANSRKAQDLFGGSALLSYLTDRAMNCAIDEFKQGPKIIISPLLDTEFKPNRFVARIKDNSLDLKTIGSKIEETVKIKIKEIAGLKFNGRFTKPDNFDKQIEDYLEIQWLYQPILNNDYKTAYKQLFVELAEIKSISRFKQLPESGRKCSVDGRYSVKVYRRTETDKPNADLYQFKLFQDSNNVKIIETNIEDNIKIWHLQEGEGLSAVSLAKRLFHSQKQPEKVSEPHVFPSTARVSLLKLLNRNETEKLPEFKNYQRLINSKDILPHSDEQLYYRDNIKQIIDKIDPTKTVKVLDGNDAWTKAMEKAGIKEDFTKYFAIVRFDGDHMGDWLTGDNISGDLMDFHIAFTKNVNEFATAIKKAIEPLGQVIYAGGEDFMALINIHYLFEALKKIRDLFNLKVNKPLAKYKIDMKKDMTISVGVAIAHYKQPLAMVLALAKKMEHLAKETGRDRFAIGVMKHSGSRLEAVVPWTSDSEDLCPIIEEVVDDLSGEVFSTSALLNIYNFIDIHGEEIGNDLIESKIKLYVPRSCNQQKDKDILIQKKIGQLSQLLKASTEQSFANLLLIIDFLIRKTR